MIDLEMKEAYENMWRNFLKLLQIRYKVIDKPQVYLAFMKLMNRNLQIKTESGELREKPEIFETFMLQIFDLHEELLVKGIVVLRKKEMRNE